jgi:hypothetical protein
MATFVETPPVQGSYLLLFIWLSCPPSKMVNMANIPKGGGGGHLHGKEPDEPTKRANGSQNTGVAPQSIAQIGKASAP